MARKKGRIRRSFSRASKRVRRGARKAAPIVGLIGAGAYGALRQRVSDQLAPITANIPAGNIADEVGMLGVNWIVGRFIGRRVPILRQITKAGMIIEAARIGEAVATGQLGIGSTNGNGNNANNVIG